MNIFNIKFEILLIILNVVKNIDLWTINKGTSENYAFLKDTIIDSIAFDESTEYELILARNKFFSESYFYLVKNKELYQERIINTEDISGIESPLIIYDSIFYFCSRTYNRLISINEGNLKIINNKITSDNDPDNASGLRCFKMNDYIAVMYYDTHCFYGYNLKEKEYDKTYTQGLTGNFEFKAINIISSDEQLTSFLTLRKSEDENKNDIYYVTKGRFESNKFNSAENARFETNLIFFYSKIEIAALPEGQKAIIITYEPNTTHSCRFYYVEYGDPPKYEINLFSNFLNFLNESRINIAEFIDNTPLLFYSINYIDNEYLGIADLNSLITVYNFQIDIKRKIFINYGHLIKNKLFINYFNDSYFRIKYCPFIKMGDDCIYYIKKINNEYYFSISKNGNYYSNSNVSTCDNLLVNELYCLDECPVGYIKEGNICENCYNKGDANNRHYYNLKRKTCTTSTENCKLIQNNICFDCDDDTPFIYDYKCISSCEEIYGEDDGNSLCIRCKDKNKYFYKKNNTQDFGKCLDECLGEVDPDFNICTKCEDKGNGEKYLRLIKGCVEECPQYFIEENNECLLCPKDTDGITYYEESIENGKTIKNCVKNCTNIAYGQQNKTENKFNFTLDIFFCNKCQIIEQDDVCVDSCKGRYIPQEDNITNYTYCLRCPDNAFFVQNNIKECKDDKCPDHSKMINNNTCEYCEENYYKEDENNCVLDCSEYDLGSEEKEYIKYCVKCNDTQILSDGKCIKSCEGNRYKNLNNICKQCLCINNECNTSNYPYSCDCSGENYSYGYNCEFYSEENINSKDMYIISLDYNNRLIQTQKNYFTYKMAENKKLNEKSTFDWKCSLNNDEIITNNKLYEKYFTTGTNESIFGINKELFDFSIKNNRRIYLSLTINNNNNTYSHKIEIRIVKYEVLDSQNFKIGHFGEPINYEMRTIYNLNNKANFRINEMQYYFQYEFLDYYNERIPITPYSESENINFYSPYLKGLYINVKNDRDIVTSILIPLEEETSLLNMNIKDINNSIAYSEIEKIYALISNLRGNEDNLINNGKTLQIINDTIINNIKKTINKNGYYYDKNNENNNEIGDSNRNIINYLEPKLVFSLINFFLINQKEYLINISNIDFLFKYFDLVFKEVFDKEKLSKQTLSESDIKSLFRTLDNFYDTLISASKINKETTYQKFIDILDNICKYLSYIAYPSETIKLVGKRISLLNFNLGEHQFNISFPFIDNMDNITLNNFLNYSYNNYYLNEKICSKKNTTFFCLNENDIIKLKDFIKKKNYSLNNVSLNLYLLQDITRENENKLEEFDSHGHSESDNTINYITIFKNYSLIIRLFDKRNNTIISLDNSDINFDAEFQFERQLDENDKNNNIDSIVEEFYQSENFNIAFFPNNSNLTCVPKNYKDKEKLESYLCKTYFNYDEKKVRCKCNLTDGITVINNYEISQIFKAKQFPQKKYEFLNIYSSKIMLIIILLLLIASFYFLIKDIINDSKYITNNQNIAQELQDERKSNYMKVKKYYNVGTLRFSLYLTLRKFPYFAIFNNYKLSYPRYIIHLVIYIGILIGFIIPLIPFYNIPFLERQIFIDQRDIKYDDDFISDVGPSKYRKYFFYFGLIGLILSRIFIYIFYIILGYYQEEKDIWLKIKTICKDYVYYEVKSEVLLGTSWNKIKIRIISFYYICGNYILKKIKKQQNIQKYLNYVSRKAEERNTISEIGSILPRGTINSNFRNTNSSNDINLIKKNKKELEMTDKNQLLIEDDDDENNVFKNKSINDKKRMLTFHINKRNKKNNNIENSKICKTDNFILDNSFKNDKSKRRIERFEKIRNKYIYKLKRNVLNEIDVDGEMINLNGEKKHLYISPQINYSINQIESFNTFKEIHKEKDSKNKIKKFIFISFVLWVFLIVLCILAIFLIKVILNKFGKFIIEAWLYPLLLVIIGINFILYYLKILIGLILIFCFYNSRKKKCFCRFLFWIFVDKTMIHIYKIRNLITKYKKEFDYL